MVEEEKKTANTVAKDNDQTVQPQTTGIDKFIQAEEAARTAEILARAAELSAMFGGVRMSVYELDKKATEAKEKADKAEKEAEEARKKAKEAEKEGTQKAEEAANKAEEAAKEAREKANKAEKAAKEEREKAEAKAKEAREKATEARKKATEARKKAEEVRKEVNAELSLELDKARQNRRNAGIESRRAAGNLLIQSIKTGLKIMRYRVIESLPFLSKTIKQEAFKKRKQTLKKLADASKRRVEAKRRLINERANIKKIRANKTKTESIWNLPSRMYAAMGFTPAAVKQNYKEVKERYKNANKGQWDKDKSTLTFNNPNCKVHFNKHGKADGLALTGYTGAPFTIVIKDKKGKPREAISVDSNGNIVNYKSWDRHGRESDVVAKDSAFDKNFLSAELLKRGKTLNATVAAEKLEELLKDPVKNKDELLKYQPKNKEESLKIVHTLIEAKAFSQEELASVTKDFTKEELQATINHVKTLNASRGLDRAHSSTTHEATSNVSQEELNRNYSSYLQTTLRSNSPVTWNTGVESPTAVPKTARNAPEGNVR